MKRYLRILLAIGAFVTSVSARAADLPAKLPEWRSPWQRTDFGPVLSPSKPGTDSRTATDSSIQSASRIFQNE